MNRKEIEKLVITSIQDKLHIDCREKVTLNATLEDDLGVDSLDAVELAMEFEKTLDISIPDETLFDRRWHTAKVSDVADEVCKLKGIGKQQSPSIAVIPLGCVVEHCNKESQSGYPHDGQYIVKREVRMKDFTTGKWYDAVEYESIELPHERYVREKSDFKDKFKVVE